MREEAERIIDMFGDKSILHVTGLIKELEYHKWQNRLRVEYWQDILEIIKNK